MIVWPKSTLATGRKRWDDIEHKAIDVWATDVSGFTPPGGESVADLQRRVIDFADSLDCSRVVLVSHAGVLRALIGYWRRLPLRRMVAIDGLILATLPKSRLIVGLVCHEAPSA